MPEVIEERTIEYLKIKNQPVKKGCVVQVSRLIATHLARDELVYQVYSSFSSEMNRHASSTRDQNASESKPCLGAAQPRRREAFSRRVADSSDGGWSVCRLVEEVESRKRKMDCIVRVSASYELVFVSSGSPAERKAGTTDGVDGGKTPNSLDNQRIYASVREIIHSCEAGRASVWVGGGVRVSKQSYTCDEMSSRVKGRKRHEKESEGARARKQFNPNSNSGRSP
ncbi:hypothetical protein R3P38DRAFT_2807717 [Favolaschia claudopus]|uniref:Uncharacterized protein n=1 Tax=Favolaschia claudopus TaxID=2862362 RepID=A0AAV9ZI63_9AGAR